MSLVFAPCRVIHSPRARVNIGVKDFVQKGRWAVQKVNAEIEQLLRRIRYDLTAAQAKVSEALNALAAANARPGIEIEAKTFKCEFCGLEFKREDLVTEHILNVHMEWEKQ